MFISQLDLITILGHDYRIPVDDITSNRPLAVQLGTIVSWIKEQVSITGTASGITIDTIPGMDAENVQEALEWLKENAGLADAPSDDTTYGRKNGEWVEVTGGGSSEQVQSDWEVTDTTSKAYIKNKPTIPDPYTKTEVDAKVKAVKDIADANTTDIADIKEKDESQDASIQKNATNISANSALIKSLQEQGLPTGAAYAFMFLEESAMDGLTKDNTTENILYFGLEEEEEEASVTIDGNTVTVDGDVTLSGNTVTVSNATYNNNTITL